MSAFTLDTLAPVAERAEDGDLIRYIHWSDLSPFEQGYVEAMIGPGLFKVPGFDVPQKHPYPAFHLLAPETLAAIRKDCAAMVDPPHVFRNDAEAGAKCWRARQEGWSFYSGGPSLRDRFPPLTPSLGDDGKVWLRAAIADTAEQSVQARDEH